MELQINNEAHDLISLFEDLSESVFIVSHEDENLMEILSCNQKACSRYFYDKNELIGMNFVGLEDNEYKGWLKFNSTKIDLFSKEKLFFRADHKKSDGEIFTALIRVSRILSNNKKLLLVVISEQGIPAMSLSDLAFEQQKLMKILDSLNKGIISLDLLGRVVFVNKSIENTFKIDREVIVLKDATEFLKRIGIIIDGDSKTFVKDMMFTYKNSDKEIKLAVNYDDRIFEVGFSVLLNPLASKSQLILRFLDKTQLSFLDEQLKQTQKMQAVGQLVGGIAHDFNNILGAITNSAALLKGGGLDETQVENVAEIILSSSRNAANLIRRLLSFASSDDLQQEKLDVFNLLADTMSIFKRVVEDSIQVEVDFSEELKLANILGNASELESSILNILINSQNAIIRSIDSNNGKIRISAKLAHINAMNNSGLLLPVKDGDYVVISIVDNGIGIKSKDLPKIFEPYFSTDESHKGVGLGLAMAYGTVKRHKGSLTVESKFKQGTSLNLYIPVASMKEFESDDKQNVLDQGMIDFRGNLNKTLLLVGANQAGFESITEYLIEWSCQIHIETSIQAAYVHYKSYAKAIDFLLIDNSIIDGTAYQCIAALQGINPKAKIIVQGPGFSEEEKRIFEAKGVVAIMKRPYKLVELLKILKD